MSQRNIILLAILSIGIILTSAVLLQAQEIDEESWLKEEALFEEVPEEGAGGKTAEPEKEISLTVTKRAVEETEEEVSSVEETATGNVTLDFKDADIRNVLRILSYKGGVNIVAGKGVEGPVTIRLTDVPWDQALSVLLKTYDYGYEKEGNIITVIPMEELTRKKLAERELAEVEPLLTEVFKLKYLDANDAKKVLEAQLSSRGKITVLEVKGMKGWKFAGLGEEEGSAFGRREREKEEEGAGKAKVLVISDITSYMDKIKEVIAKIDVMPKQILIETRIMEVNRDVLKDIGFDWGTGATGASTSAVGLVDINSNNTGRFGIQNTGSEVTPAPFDPKSTGILGYEPFPVGLEVMFKKLSGAELQVILHALEEDVRTNTLSAPRIMTLENQEATIMVGTKYPIIKQESETSETGVSTVTGGSLERYENIGIQLFVVPQISGKDYVNMIVHPTVSSLVGWEYVTGTSSGTRYPKIDTRETETQILIKNGETVVIGGLLKDVKSKGKISVPILGDIPILGLLFQRDTTDTQKIDLLIFITATIVEPEMGLAYKYGRQSRIPSLEDINQRDTGYGEDLDSPKQKAVEKPKKAGVIEVPKKK